MLPSKSNYGDTKPNTMEGTSTDPNFQTTTNQAAPVAPNLDQQSNFSSNLGTTNQTIPSQESANAPNIPSPTGSTTTSNLGTSGSNLGNAPTGISNIPTGTAPNMSQNVIFKQLPPQFERREKPMIVQEKIVPTERVEIQPVIHRDREIPEFREIIQPMRERNIVATEIRNITLPAEYKPTVTLTDNTFENRRGSLGNRYATDTITAPVQREVVTKPPIVKEVIHKRIIEEVQPIIYKEVVRPVIVTQTQTIFERFIDKPRVVEQTRAPYEVLFPAEGYGQQGYSQQFAQQPWNVQAPLQGATPEVWQRQGLANLPMRGINPSSTQMDERQWSATPSFTQTGQPNVATYSGTGLSNLPQRQVAPSANFGTGYNAPNVQSGFTQGGFGSGLSNLPQRQVISSPQVGDTGTTFGQSGFNTNSYGQNIPTPPPAPSVEYLWKERAPWSSYSSFQGSGSNIGASSYGTQSGFGNNPSSMAVPPAPPVEYLWKERTPLSFQGRQNVGVLVRETTKEPWGKWNSSLGGMTQQTTPTTFGSV